MKRIRKEWRILQSGLPDGVYVQTYGDRADLLRALIIGPHGTPYAGGGFFFDILCGDDYPNKPPEVR